MCYNSESNDDSIESAGSGTCISKNSRTLRLKIHYDIFNLSLDKSESSKYKRHFEKWKIILKLWAIIIESVQIPLDFERYL